MTEDGDSRARIAITFESDGSVVVRAFDAWDGEEYVVNGLLVEPDRISFEVFAPSTQARYKSSLKVDPEGDLIYELTSVERWIKDA